MSTCTTAHPHPPFMEEVLPPLIWLPYLATTVAAAAANCAACNTWHRNKAAELGTPVAQALSVFLMYTAVLLNLNKKEPGATTEDMVRNLAPDTLELLSAPTRGVLACVSVEATRDTPDGSLAATWNREALSGLVDGLTLAQRKVTWNEAMGLLVGIVQGEGRARAEAGE